jgi:2-polyprenyl-3-methyl-5-hydroxy-6-metoxy-1,4-benzoquinol methylase
MSHEFDRYRYTYRDQVQRSIRFSGQDVGFFTDVKARLLSEIAGRHVGRTSELAALDVGCGVGLTDSFLRGRFKSLHGVDVSTEAVEQAAAANPWATYADYHGNALPFEDGRFDVVFAICVLHHVERPDRAAFTGELARVVRHGGIVVVFEHNPFNPLTRLAVSRCDFDEGVVLLRRKVTRALFVSSGLEVAESSYIVFFPWRAGILRQTERVIGWLPFGAQYVVAGRRV